ncbi:MAG: DEAD/DEAH box helicase [Treponema sp. GWB1_62_6]|nr:MAG: DEAD/DEAH box helicase [Treponema sp. GWC1_61_84]OHE71013.1 MAG: DEAD/DEAH box helicase [Treponema sp. GWB1_62_6]OHE71781.1 MAG: DEAD/DEAH box helicase [Treponema sp. RIFOXYC1_FULL_61_9]HCM25646.1 DEAD/DEAH box helicase [Treponema sp.]
MPNIELDRLRSENERLRALLETHGIPWAPDLSDRVLELQASMPIAEKVALFRRLFSGREDLFALRWESAKGGAGYTPACAHEWERGVCEKPRIKCGACPKRELLPITDQVIYNHLAGKHTVGVYPLLVDDTCRFLAADFDEADWKGDSLAFIKSCREFGLPAGLEISRSGSGAHVWIFFSGPVPARNARRLGAALVSHTCERTRQLSLASYDRFFPNQDNLPAGGFGNLIALPLQRKPRERGTSVFVDDDFQPWLDQWTFLSGIVPLENVTLEPLIMKITGGRHPLDVAFIGEDEAEIPWKARKPRSDKLDMPLPKSINLILADRIYIEKDRLPQALANRIIRLAAFQNPEYYKAQAMRFSVWDKPRIIGCAENHPKHIAIPRGCREALADLLALNGIEASIADERFPGSPISAALAGTLREDQQAALEGLLAHETGVLSAPTAFGKTVIAAALIARRKTNTLIIVHRTDLARQWAERLGTFLTLEKDSLGLIGGGKKKPSGKIDIAVMQTLARLAESDDLFEHYGQVIVDECHHLSAISFESVLKRFKARYVIGITATPIRRDGHHPIIFMQCGPIRYKAKRSQSDITSMKVIAKRLPAPAIPEGAGIQDVFKLISLDAARNLRIVDDISEAYWRRRKVLVLTERTEHLELLSGLIGSDKSLFILHGRMKKKARDQTIASLAALNDDDPRIILATGKLVGEGFDHPALDTLVLAMPISWKGTLQQYAGRLHREKAGKTAIEIYDYVESDNSFLARIWEKRKKGYLAMGYTI